MSQSERERALRALEQSWRERRVEYQEQFVEESKREYHITAAQKGGLATAFKVCADELAAVLDTPQEPTPSAEADALLMRWLSVRTESDPSAYERRCQYAFEATIAYLNRRPAAPEPTPAAPPDTFKEKSIAELLRYYGRVVLLDSDLAAFTSAINALAAAPRPALSPDAPATSGDDDKGARR